MQQSGRWEIMAPDLVQTKRKHRYVVVSWRIGERKIDSLQRGESRFAACVGVRDMEPVPSILNDDSRFRRFVVSNAYFEKTHEGPALYSSFHSSGELDQRARLPRLTGVC